MPRRSTQAAKKTAAKKTDGKKPSQPQPQRLQRLLASAGFGSRRLCEELIEAGRVEVDGQLVTKLGSTVDPDTSKVRVDGVILKKQKLVYYAVNKPTGVVTTNSDPHGRPRVVDLVPKSERVYPVGRLDRSSEGLILLTNDGDLAQKLTHPKFGVRKVYRVMVAGRVDGETMKRMRQGIFIAEGRVSVEGAKVVKARGKATEMEIILREGKNREIRRILARLGHKVLQLRRIAVGPLRLGDMPPGAYRIVSREEVRKLQKVTEPSSETDSTKRGSKRGGTTRGGGSRVARKTVPPKGGKPDRKAGGKPDRKGRKKAKAPIGVGLSKGSSAGGVVIGADPAPADDKPRRKKSAKRKPTSTRSVRSSGGKRATKRGAKGRSSAGGKAVVAKGGRRARNAETGGRGKPSAKKPVARKRKR
jgi:23S rRNA pseudouridine2605 synthase